MTEHRIYVPETGEKFELLCGRSQLRRMVKLIEGKKIFRKAVLQIPRYHVPEEAYQLIKEKPNYWIFRDKDQKLVWMVDKRPKYTKYGVVFPTGEIELDICSWESFIPENTIVACSDILKYGRVVNE